MGKTDITIVPVSTNLQVTEDTLSLPMVHKTCDYSFGTTTPTQTDGVVLQTLKCYRQLVIKIKEIGPGITVEVVIVRNNEVVQTIDITNDSDLYIAIRLVKGDSAIFGYRYPSLLLPPPVLDFEASIMKKKY